jgi:hypothetical protein
VTKLRQVPRAHFALDGEIRKSTCNKRNKGCFDRLSSLPVNLSHYNYVVNRLNSRLQSFVPKAADGQSHVAKRLDDSRHDYLSYRIPNLRTIAGIEWMLFAFLSHRLSSHPIFFASHSFASHFFRKSLSGQPSGRSEYVQSILHSYGQII